MTQRQRWRGFRGHRNRTYLVPAMLALTLAAVASGCGSGRAATATAGSAPKSSEFTASAAAGVLAAFDHADSAASAAGDLDALKLQETTPSLYASTASVHRAQARQTSQPAFQHMAPTFAIPAAPADCFLASATLKLVGEELNLADVSQFVLVPGSGWKISHNVQIGSDGVAALRGMNPVATSSTTAISDQSRQAIQNEIFARTTGSSAAYTVVASNTELDKQLAVGWTFYQKQMSSAGMTVTRSLDKAAWSDCAARTATGTAAFLTLSSTDTITPKHGGPATASLAPASPDMVSLGETAPVKGKTVKVSRVDVFLVLVPNTAGTPATVLGLSDAPVSATTS